MKRCLQMLFVIVLSFFIVGSAWASIVYQVGIDDNFAAGSELTAPSANLVAAVLANQNYQQNAYIADFQDLDLTAGLNNGSADRAIGHTFTNLPSNITGATLELRVRAGSDQWTGSDQLLLSFVQYDISHFQNPSDYANYWVDSLAWFRSFGLRSYPYAPSGYQIPDDPGLLQGTTWTSGDEYVVTLDLAMLPLVGGTTLNLIPDLNTFGFLDVVVEDDSAVDFMRLTVETVPVPVPPSVLLLAPCVLGLVGFRRQTFRTRKA